jgi:pimeloyl-ACP methyl ester carboxylesterase
MRGVSIMNQNFGDRWPKVVMDDGAGHAPSCDRTVIALHCSGADRSQWRNLAPALGCQFRFIAPNLIGSGDRGPWGGRQAFSLMDEAQSVIELVDGLDEPVSLVGHSYGGGVALKVATERPTRVASLALYEPSAFHILRQVRASADLIEIEGLASEIGDGLVTGAYRKAAATFVEYWNGPGAWASLRPAVRDAVVAWLPKAPLDFRALIEDDTPLTRLADISCPVLLLRGQHALGPSRRITDELARLLPNRTTEIVAGAGHMGPLTHGPAVNLRIAAHVCAVANARMRKGGSKAIAA